MAASLRTQEGPRAPSKKESLNDIEQEIQRYIQANKKDNDEISAIKILSCLIQLEALPEAKNPLTKEHLVIKPQAVHDVFWKNKPTIITGTGKFIIGWRNRAFAAATGPKTFIDRSPQHRAATQPYNKTQEALSKFCGQPFIIKRAEQSQNSREYEFMIGNHATTTLSALEGAVKIVDLFNAAIRQIQINPADITHHTLITNHDLRMEWERGQPKILISNNAFKAIFDATSGLTDFSLATAHEVKGTPTPAVSTNASQSLYASAMMAPAAATSTPNLTGGLANLTSATIYERKSSPVSAVIANVPGSIPTVTAIPAAGVPAGTTPTPSIAASRSAAGWLVIFIRTEERILTFDCRVGDTIGVIRKKIAERKNVSPQNLILALHRPSNVARTAFHKFDEKHHQTLEDEQTLQELGLEDENTIFTFRRPTPPAASIAQTASYPAHAPVLSHRYPAAYPSSSIAPNTSNLNPGQNQSYGFR
jgi:hypothetical protein